MAFDIAAIQQLYGARTDVHANDSYYELFDSAAASSHMGWQCLWDTGGTDTIAYNGSYNAVIDLRPATLDSSATGGGMMSYTWRLGAGGSHIMTSQGYTIAGDIRNAIDNVNGVTGVLIEKAVGGDGTDRLTGNDAGNQLWGYDGIDTLIGGGGDDTLIGGGGADIVKGGSGDDTYRVDDVGDYITEMNSRHVDAGGVDLVRTKLSEYTLVESVRSQIENLTFFGSGSFTGTGNSLNNTIIGGGSDDTLIGGEGNDRLDGGVGADTMYGGAGDDIYVVNDAEDVASENEDADAGGNDTIETSLTFYTLADDPNSKIENLTLTLTAGAGGVGNSLDNIITGNNGDDFLQGNDGNDTLIGRRGHDSLIGGYGNDTYVISDTTAVIVEDVGAGTDTVQTHFAIYTLTGDIENLTFTELSVRARAFTGIGNELNNAIRGGRVADELTGNDGDDYLYGYNGKDKLFGGAGNDTLRGGTSDDQLDGGNGSDAADYRDMTAKTEINLNVGVGRVLKSTGTETDTLISIENVIGGTSNDNVTGNDNDNTFFYQGWYNRFSSSGGTDKFDGGDGSDTIDFAGFSVQKMTIDLGEGTAIASFSVDSGAGTVSRSKTAVSFLHVENIVASRGSDTITGDGADNIFCDAGAYRYQHETGGFDTYAGGKGTDTADFSRYDGQLFIDLESGDVNASYHVSLQGGGQADGFAIVAHVTGMENVVASLDIDTIMGDAADNVFYYVGAFTAHEETDGLDLYDGRGGANTVDMSKFHGTTQINLSEGTVSSSYQYDTGEGMGTATTQLATLTNFKNAVGSALADTIEGDAADNAISGGGGSDRLTGNGGSDRLTGGSGIDSFVFDTGFGHDLITDFSPSTNRRSLHDVIEFSTSVFADWDHVLAATTDTDAGAVITLDADNSVTLAGVTKQSLIDHHENDFVFA
jgi:Ca2+-binding RTX toxin-like protein